MAIYTLTINVYPSTAWGTVTPASGSQYDSTTPPVQHTPTITAFPEAGYVFSHWTGQITGNTNPTSLHMAGNYTVNAWFAIPETKDIDLPVPSVVGSFDPITPTKSIALSPSVVESDVVIPINDIDGAILKDNWPLTYTDYTTPANNDTANDVNLLPATPAHNDAFFFGVSSISVDGMRYVIDIGTAGVGTWIIVYYYYNGSAWVALPSANILLKSAQFLDFKTAGLGSLWIIPPVNWATVAVNGVTLYWIEARLTFTSKTVIPLGTRIYQSPITYATDWKKSLSDSISLIGRLYYRRPIGEEHRESFGLNDSTSKKVAKVVIDDINFSDVFVSLWARILALFDLHVLSDNMSHVWQTKKNIQDQIDFIETHGVYFEKRLFTNFNLIDIVSAYIPPKFYLFIADKLGASSSLVKFFNKSLNDIGSLNEIKEFVIGKNFSDYFNLHDMRFLVSTLIRNIYDSLPLSDIVNKLYKKGDTDSVGLYDTKTITTIKSITDNIPLSDVIHYLSNFVKNISDGLSLTDSFSMIWDVVRSIDESFGLIDSRSNRIKQSNIESISLSDIDIKKDIGKNISELPLSLVDTVSTAWAVLRSIGESLTLSDLNFFSIKKPVDDSVGIQDFFLYVRGRYLALADLQVLVDNVAKGVFQSQQEHIDFIDYHGVYFEKRTLDNFNLHDVFTAYMQGFLSISEGVGITDKIKKFTNKLLLDAESLIDNVTKKYGKNLYDYISLNDSTLLYMNNTYYISLFNRIDLYDAIAKRIILYKDDSLSLVAELLSDGYLAIQDSISLTDHLSMKVMKVLGEIIPITDDITQLLESEPFYFDKGVVEPYFVIEDLRVYGGAEMHFYPDQTVVAKWKTRYFVNDLLFDPDSHTVTVYDPKGQIRVVYNSAYLVKDSIGVYKYTFNLPTDVVGGDWYIRIKGTKGTWNSILNIHLEVRKK